MCWIIKTSFTLITSVAEDDIDRKLYLQTFDKNI